MRLILTPRTSLAVAIASGNQKDQRHVGRNDRVILEDSLETPGITFGLAPTNNFILFKAAAEEPVDQVHAAIFPISATEQVELRNKSSDTQILVTRDKKQTRLDPGERKILDPDIDWTVTFVRGVTFWVRADPAVEEVVGETPASRVVKRTQGNRVMVIKTSLKPDSKSAKQTWKQEKKILTRLQEHGGHNHIIRLHSSNEEKLGLELDYIGLDLSRYVDEHYYSTLDPMVQMVIWHDMAQALQFLEQHRIVHNDIKPQNTLLNVEGTRAVLCDFGLASRVNSDNGSGTAHYLPPEYCTTTVRTPQSDMWSLAVTMIYVMGVTRLPGHDRRFRVRSLPNDDEGREQLTRWVKHLIKLAERREIHEMYDGKLLSNRVLSSMFAMDPRERISAARLVELTGQRRQQMAQEQEQKPEVEEDGYVPVSPVLN